MGSNVDHPDHYGGKDNPYEAIKVMENWFPDDPHLFTAIKYIARSKYKGKFRQDLEKAIWYINRRLDLFKDE